MSLLTQKNLSDLGNIKALTIYRHAKHVEANCKKALAFCVGSDIPYRDYKGTFPSGTNWEDYLVWIKEKMYRAENKATVEDLVDKDDSLGLNEGEANESTKQSADIEDKMPSNKYFKGFLTFALWDYIPPDGGEKYKCSFVSTIVDKDEKVKMKDGRAFALKSDASEKAHAKLEVRGVDRLNQDENDKFKIMIDIMVKGREEISQQRLYKCCWSKIEFKLRYAESRIKEIKEELKGLKDDSDRDSDDDVVTKTKELKAR